MPELMNVVGRLAIRQKVMSILRSGCGLFMLLAVLWTPRFASSDSPSSGSSVCNSPTVVAFVSDTGSQCFVRRIHGSGTQAAKHLPALREPLSIGDSVECVQAGAALVITNCNGREEKRITYEDMRNGSYIVPSVSPEESEDRAFKEAARLAAVPTGTAVGKSDLRQHLESTYALSKVTADNTDIVTAGAVLVLQKDNLEMSKVDAPLPTRNYYKNGELDQGGKLEGYLGKLGGGAGLGALAGYANNTRRFVAGEKFWVTRIEIQDDGIEFFLLSNPLHDVRYHAVLKFAFPKGQTWTTEQVMAVVAQVIKPEADSTSSAGSATMPVQSR